MTKTSRTTVQLPYNNQMTTYTYNKLDFLNFGGYVKNKNGVKEEKNGYDFFSNVNNTGEKIEDTFLLMTNDGSETIDIYIGSKIAYFSIFEK